MSKVVVRNLPQMKLSDLLRRRKTSLKKFVNDLGISTYDSLKENCSRIGVQPPQEDEWLKVRDGFVTSPTEGIVVIDPPEIFQEDKTPSVNLSAITEKKKKKKK
jgi:hypothetical protein